MHAVGVLRLTNYVRDQAVRQKIASECSRGEPKCVSEEDPNMPGIPSTKLESEKVPKT